MVFTNNLKAVAHLQCDNAEVILFLDAPLNQSE